MYYQGKKFVTYFLIEKPCSVLPEFEYTYYSRTVLEHINFTLNFKMVSFSFQIFTQDLVILNENSLNLTENSMAKSQIV